MIYEAFLRGMSRENIFMDVDSIPLGVNFVKVLEGWVDQCEVLLVLIGAGWIISIDPKTGKRRLDNQKDYVRVEVRGALTRDIAVVPVLLDGAELPDEAELPDDIKGLLNRNAEFVEYRTFDADVQRLIKKLGVGRSTEVQGGLSDKPRAKKIINRDWAKHWVTPMAIATVLLAAAVIGILVSWTPGLLSFRKAEVTTKQLTTLAKPLRQNWPMPTKPLKLPKHKLPTLTKDAELPRHKLPTLRKPGKSLRRNWLT